MLNTPIQKHLRSIALLLLPLVCVSCAHTRTIPTKLFEKTLVLLHIRQKQPTTAGSPPAVCLLDPASEILHISPDTPSGAKETPSLVITETVYDFGEIKDQGDLVHDFKLRNAGSAILKIKKIIPG